MTREQFHSYFKVAMDKNSQSVAFGGCPAFLPEEIDYWLDQGLYQEISNKFTGNNYLKTSFEGSVKRIHDLEKLVRTDHNIEANVELNSNKCFITNLFNGNRMFFVDATLNFNNKKAAIKLIDHADVIKFKKTYNNNPWIEDPVAVIEDNTLCIYYDPMSMISDAYSVDITYIKFPTKIEDLPAEGMSEIPEYMQFEVINRAVELALEDIESKRIQTKSQLNQIDE